MQLLALARGFSVILLSGTLVGFLPALESPFAALITNELAEQDENAADNPQPQLALPGEAGSTSGDGAADMSGRTSGTQVAAADEGAPPKSKERVKVKVFLSVDKLPAGEKCRFVVLLNVDEGWHLYANPAGDENLIPTNVTVQSKHKVKQLTTKYPKGMSVMVEEYENPVSIYKGEIAVYGELQVPAGAAGKTDELEFQVEFQVCNSKSCVRKKLKLTDTIEIVKADAPIRQINQKYFPVK